MSIASEITRLIALRDTIRSKLLDFSIITDSTAKLSTCRDAIDGISESSLTVSSTVVVNPPMNINSSTGVVSVSGVKSDTAILNEGYSKGLSKVINPSVSGSLQLETLGAQTITPGTADKTIAAGQWLTGAQTIKGDSNLIAANIKSGTSIFGVSGNLQGGKIKTAVISREQLVPRYYNQYTNEDGEVIVRYLWYVPIDISGINPRYVYMTSPLSSSIFTYAILNGTYVINGYAVDSSKERGKLDGTTLLMQETNLLIPYRITAMASAPSSSEGATVYLLGQ